MNSSLLLTVALLTPTAPIPRDTAPSATGPAPRVLALKADASGAVRVIGTIPTKVTVTNTHFIIENVVENGQQVQKQVQKQVEQDVMTSQYMNKALSEFNATFATANGSPLTLEEAIGRIKNGATVLASSDGKPIAKSWLHAVAPDTVVMTAEGLSHVQPQWGGAPLPTTPAPRLAMVGTDETGKVMAACTSQPLNPNGEVYYDDLMFEGRAWKGGRAIRGGGIYYGDQYQQSTAKVVLKPLADVKFDAYDQSGKLISKTEVMKRLAAGGMVLVAGDNRMPDETYLKAFKDDVLILSGPELLLPVAPVDQTRKKEPMKDPANPKAQPMPVAPIAPGVQPLPIKLAPAVIKGRAAGAVVPVAPAAGAVQKTEKVEEKKVEEKKVEENKVEENKVEENKVEEKRNEEKK